MHAVRVCVVAALATGCAKGGGFEWPDLKALLPTVQFDRMEVEGADFTRIDTRFVLGVDNPHPIAVQLGSLSSGLSLAGEPFVDGTGDERLAIAPQDRSEVAVPVGVAWADLPGAILALTGTDGAPYDFHGTIGVDTPIGEVAVPFQTEGVFPVLRPPRIGFVAVRLADLDFLTQSATLGVDLSIAHDQGSALSVAGFDYALTLGGTAVVDGVVETLAEVAPGSAQTVTLPVRVNLLKLGSSVADAIRKQGQVDVGLTATMTVGTPLGPIPLSIDQTGAVSVTR